jgi:hypothetical protein
MSTSPEPTKQPVDHALSLDRNAAYQAMIKGVLITCVVTNVLTLAAIVAVAFYTVHRIDRVADAVHATVDKSYENTAKVASAAVASVTAVGERMVTSVAQDAQAVRLGVHAAAQGTAAVAKDTAAQLAAAAVERLRQRRDATQAAGTASATAAAMAEPCTALQCPLPAPTDAPVTSPAPATARP